jgi:NADH-quinone oxidoreductase subunit K
VAFNRYLPDNHTGQLFAFFVIAVAAAEAAVGLAIVISLFRLKKTVHSDRADTLRH